MHEYFDVEEYNKYLVVQAQAALFVLGYHGYMGVQSLWQTVLAVLVVAWTTGEITSVTSMIAALVGLLLGVACVRVTKVRHAEISYHQVFYFLVQPAVLFYTLPLYVEQTMYPVGAPLSFLLWLGMNMVVWTFAKHHHLFRVVAVIPIASIFLFTWVLSKFAWVPLGVTAGVVVLLMGVVLHLRESEKMS